MSKFRPWSPTRPKRPADDPLFEQIRKQLIRDRRTVWHKADDSGLSTSTLRNWQNGKVRQPKAVSLQMAAELLGKKIVLVSRR